MRQKLCLIFLAFVFIGGFYCFSRNGEKLEIQQELQQIQNKKHNIKPKSQIEILQEREAQLNSKEISASGFLQAIENGGSKLCWLLKKIFWVWGVWLWDNVHPLVGLLYFLFIGPIALRIAAGFLFGAAESSGSSSYDNSSQINANNQFLETHNTNRLLEKISDKISKVY